MRKNTVGDWLIIGGIVIIGLAEAVHLASLFLRFSFTRYAILLGALVGAAFAAGMVLLAARGRRSAKALFRRGGARPGMEAALYALFGVIFISQLIFICMGDTIQKDMMVETVGSFLASDGIYQVNPMTGMPYTDGAPLRWKILCLPGLYGSLCRLTGLGPSTVVWRLAPTVVLAGCYTAYALLGKALFPDNGRKRACFLLAVGILLWAGAYGYGMDGFGVLCCGWQGTTIRSAVLLPWLLSLCLRKKWRWAVSCVLAEACVVWTFYGCGACLAVAAGMALAQLCARRLRLSMAGGRGGAGKEGVE